MKKTVLFCASALILTPALSVLAQTTTVDSVVGPDGQPVPSASGILNPHVTEGRFGPSLQGGYFGPAPNRPESRFSNNALYGYSGQFIGMLGDADAERAELSRRAQDEEELSDIDKLTVMRYMRRQAQAQQEEEPPLLQRSAEPYAEPLPYPARSNPAEETPPAPSGEQDAAGPVPAPPEPAPPARPESEQIWMRGSARYTEAAARRRGTAPPAQDDSLMIDPRWFEFGADAPAQGAPEQNAPAPPQDNSADMPFEEGMVIGGRLPDAPPASDYPSEVLARNGRQEQARSAAAAQELETRLLQSPLVSPLAPIRVRLNGNTAVVTGIVGSDAARLEAGKLLLQDRRVETVDNRIVVYSENAAEPSENGSAEPQTPETRDVPEGEDSPPQE